MRQADIVGDKEFSASYGVWVGSGGLVVQVVVKGMIRETLVATLIENCVEQPE